MNNLLDIPINSSEAFNAHTCNEMLTISIPVILIHVILLVQSNACQKAVLSVDENAKLNMTIYIESLCKFSKIFIHKQLRPIYDDIKDQVNVKFVTFALSEVI